MAEFTPAQKEVLFKIALDTTTQAKELAMKESEARIAAMANNVFTPSSSVLTVEEDNDAIGELPLEARKVTAIYLGLPRKEIAAIYKGKFIPENLYKLRMLYGRDNKDWTTQFTIGLSGDLQFKRIKGTLKDFGNTTAIWSTGFLNYSGIMLELFNSAFPTLHRKLLTYHQQIIELSSTYEWQEAVLPLAIEYYTEIVAINHTDVEAWTIPCTWIDRFCTSTRTIKAGTISFPPSTQAKLREPNNATVLCQSFNGKGCHYSSCRRQHKCPVCSSKGHREPGCKGQ